MGQVVIKELGAERFLAEFEELTHSSCWDVERLLENDDNNPDKRHSWLGPDGSG